MSDLKPMFDPPHPGEFISQVYRVPFGVSVRTLAARLAVSPSTLSRVLMRSSRVTPEMAIRLSKVLGRSPGSWLAMQDAHDLNKARARMNVDHLEPLDLAS
ncbi:MAG: HigA family addiction module antitoxin [Microbacterium sp.]